MSSTAATIPTLKTDATVISLVGFAHATSHFFHLMLPPLFPWFMSEFQLNFMQAGTMMTAFFVVSGIGQAFAGIVVDRFGAHRVLCAGVGLLACSGLLVALSPNFACLIAAAMVAGVGNSVFHPADFTIINRRVSVPRLGHAFSVHGLSGNIGWAAGPVLMLGLATAFGWRVAALGAALVGALALAFLIWKRDLLQYELSQQKTQKTTEKTTKKTTAFATDSTWRFLGVPVVWFAFLFFFFSTFAFGALQNFAPSLLRELYGVSLGVATSSLTAYLLGSTAGLACGGFLVKSQARFEYFIAIALACSASIAFLFSTGLVPQVLILPIMALMGFGVGIAGPSRDMLVRRATAARLGESAFGRVYGMVYSGLDVGLAVSPLVFGLLLDHKQYHFVFIGIGCAFMGAIFAALAVGKQIERAP